MSEYEIPGHVLIIMVIICLYSRDGVLMKKQVTVTNDISVARLKSRYRSISA